MFTIIKKDNSANVKKKKAPGDKNKGTYDQHTKRKHLVHSNKSSQFKHLRQGPFCAVTPKTSSQRCAA